MGASITQIFWHLKPIVASLLPLFAGYGNWGALCYRFEMLFLWWPYVVMISGGLFYGTMGFIIASWVQRGTKISGTV
ncbi:hypothetical protein SAMN00768000_1121 [Sulfobacillus thermosulfidooxidans DSM 9293]|uniref:Uncharacterized protein n=2 Tax=Sulfobacillus thermosulfidooxidans TaxID=28034 RepID=A0A1W1WBU2_SULTA|nr:hypothetical protein [Sulfobacillus thermosulfidooxidans]SMC03500.1 hypothetical protein SAMN00768000_1121 [Sulfobacillus thermosulfidooxidans DSM 9293]